MPLLEYYIDFKSPAAYLSLQPTMELQQKYPLEIRWRPYRTLEKAVPAEKANESKGETHLRVRASARKRIHLKYAALRGLPMRYPDRPGSTDLALAALNYASSSADSHPAGYAEMAFSAYWLDNKNLDDLPTVMSLLTRSGHDSKGFEAKYWLAALEAGQAPAEARGVIDAPAYVLNEQVFIGREHMPWIRELLGTAHSPA